MARSSRGQGRRTDYSWASFGDTAVAQPVGSTALLGVTSFLFSDAGTLTRMRGKVGITLDTAGIDEFALILCGLVIMGVDAVTAGAAPEIFGGGIDEGSWIWQGALFVASGSEGGVNQNTLNADIEIDSKAMRRVKSGQNLVFVHQSPVELAVDQGGTYDLVYFVHLLFGS